MSVEDRLNDEYTLSQRCVSRREMFTQRRCPQRGVHREVFTERCSQRGVHREVSTERCPQRGVHREVFTERCSQTVTPFSDSICSLLSMAALASGSSISEPKASSVKYLDRMSHGCSPRNEMAWQHRTKWKHLQKYTVKWVKTPSKVYSEITFKSIQWNEWKHLQKYTVKWVKTPSKVYSEMSENIFKSIQWNEWKHLQKYTVKRVKTPLKLYSEISENTFKSIQ